MQVPVSFAYSRMVNRSAQPTPLTRQTSGPQRFADMPGVKAVDKAHVPALSQLRWIAMDVEHSRKSLQGLQSFRNALGKSIAQCSEHIKLAQALITKHGPDPRFLAMIDTAQKALRERLIPLLPVRSAFCRWCV
jgi:hypothetical protein